MSHSGKNAGFTLVELMVALLIGLLILLGAVQIYLMGLRNLKDAEALGDRQAALTYAADVLIRDIRRADLDSSKTCSNKTGVTPPFRVDGKCRYYDLDDSSGTGEISLRVKEDDGGWQPLVSGFKDMKSLSIKPAGNGLFKIAFDLAGESEIVFHAQNRSSRF